MNTPVGEPRLLNKLHIGAHYFVDGIRLLGHPKLRAYILVPLLVNCAIFAVLTSLVITNFDYLTQFDWNFPEWLEFLEKTLKWVVWFLLVVVIIIAYGYTFNMLTNIIAAPFYGLLAQRTEELLSGESLPDEPLYKMVPRTLFREMKKLMYFVTRGIFILLLMLLLGTLPLLNFLVPVIGTLWGAWSMALQYADYPADNHQTEFQLLRRKLRYRKYSSIGFGATVLGCSMIPVLNILAMPAAVVGGTVYWLHELKALENTTEPS